MFRNGSKSRSNNKKNCKEDENWVKRHKKKRVYERTSQRKKWCRLTYFLLLFNTYTYEKKKFTLAIMCHVRGNPHLGSVLFSHRVNLQKKKMRKSSSTWVAIYLLFTYQHSHIPPVCCFSLPPSCSSAYFAVAFTAKWQWKVNVHYVDYFFILFRMKNNVEITKIAILRSCGLWFFGSVFEGRSQKRPYFFSNKHFLDQLK